jgi:hypothetical protein
MSTESGAPPPYHYIVYIDEAGDSGLTRVRPHDPTGGSEWMTIGAVVTTVANELAPVEWVRKILQDVGQPYKRELHYRELTEWRKPLVCSHVGELDLTVFVLTSNKKNMRQHSNPRAARRSALHPNEWFYNYCIRLVLERVTDYCLCDSLARYGSPRYVKIVFSERGGHSHPNLISYLEMLKRQSRSGTTHLKKRVIRWQVVDWRLMTARPNSSVAGLQLSDVVASSFFQAVDILPPTDWNPNNAKLLRPRVAKECGLYLDYGLTFQPMPPDVAQLLPKQREIFEFYGFDGREFDGWGPQ